MPETADGAQRVLATCVSEIDLESLVDRHYRRIHRAALVMTGSAWEADDLAQDTFLHAIRSLKRFAGNSRVETWLYAILINQHRRRIRTRERRDRRLRRWWEWVWQSPQPVRPESELELNEWRKSIWGQVAELPEAQRHAMVLRYSEELSYEEIARVLECPVGTVKSRLHHALAALRSKLGDGDHPCESGNGSVRSAKKRLVNDIRHE